MSGQRPPRGRVPPARRRRPLTEDEEALWRRFIAAAGVVPLRPDASPAQAQEPSSSDAADAPPAANPPAPTLPPARRSAAPIPGPDLAVGVAPGGLDRKRWDALRRGRLAPERTLDLHGRKAEEAHRAVAAFVVAAHAQGLRCIAIVTGKGSGETGGVLRRELPHWLNAPALRPLILALAHPHRANTGAVHVLLRRKK